MPCSFRALQCPFVFFLPCLRTARCASDVVLLRRPRPGRTRGRGLAYGATDSGPASFSFYAAGCVCRFCFQVVGVARARISRCIVKKTSQLKHGILQPHLQYCGRRARRGGAFSLLALARISCLHSLGSRRKPWRMRKFALLVLIADRQSQGNHSVCR